MWFCFQKEFFEGGLEIFSHRNLERFSGSRTCFLPQIQESSKAQLERLFSNQVLIFLRWLRYLLFVVLAERTSVLVNMDETSIASKQVEPRGWAVSSQVRNRQQWRRRQPVEDRTDVKTTLMGVVCDQPALQPYLPQVFLPSYTKRALPPQWARDKYAAAGAPLEYWHRTRGGVTVQIIRQWATNLRRAVHSFNEATWIVLLWDCHNTHLDINVARHLARLGILLIIVPAKCTWLTQLLDVYVFAVLKSKIAQFKAAERLAAPDGQCAPGSWIDHTARATRATIVTRDWSEHFERLGATLNNASLRPELLRYVGDDPIMPRLPLRAEFARLVHRNADTQNTWDLHHCIMSQALRVQGLPPDAEPPRGALVHQPDVPPAQPWIPGEHFHGDWDTIVGQHLDNIEVEGVLDPEAPGLGPARQVVVAPILGADL